MEEGMDPDEFKKLFGEFDEAKVEMEVATQALSNMYLAFRKHGITPWEAALIIAAIIKTGGDGVQNKRDGESEHEA